MDKNGPNKGKGKENKNNGKKIGYLNNMIKPYMCFDGYLHCSYCRRRYEPGHLCEQQYL